MKRTLLILSLFIASFLVSSCDKVDSQVSEETASFLASENIGVYENGKAIYEFDEFQDQLSTISNQPNGKSLRFQNARKAFAYSIEGIPAKAEVGTTFTVKFTEYVADANNKILQMNAEFIKVEEGKAWIQCPDKQKGFIINY